MIALLSVPLLIAAVAEVTPTFPVEEYTRLALFRLEFFFPALFTAAAELLLLELDCIAAAVPVPTPAENY